MLHINRVTLLGNAGRDPEIRTMQQSGDEAASFSLATTERWKRRDGEPAEVDGMAPGGRSMAAR